MTPDVCPNCGAEVPRATPKPVPNAARMNKPAGRKTAYASQLGLPDENFDYDKYIKREFAGEKVVPRGIHWFWWLVALLVLSAFAYLWLR